MQVAVVAPAERDRELITDLEADRSRLGGWTRDRRFGYWLALRSCIFVLAIKLKAERLAESCERSFGSIGFRSLKRNVMQYLIWMCGK
jgi:hypothetical protein